MNNHGCVDSTKCVVVCGLQKETNLIIADMQMKIADATCELIELRQQLAEAEAIVAKLPRTKDGVAITPNCELWYLDSEKIRWVAADHFGIHDYFWSLATYRGWIPIDRFYSTRKAAEEALLIENELSQQYREEQADTDMQIEAAEAGKGK
jgi:hypothetical protein